MTKPRLQSRVTLMGMVVVLVAAAIVGAAFVHRVNLLMLLFALIVSIGFVGTWSGRRQLLGLRQDRVAPSVVAVGDRFYWIVQLTSQSHRRLIGLTVEDSLTPRTNPRPRPTRLRSAGKGEVVEGRFEGFIARRGEFRFGPPRVSTGFPFGLVRWRISLPEPANPRTLLVHPTLGRLTTSARQRLGLTSIGEGASRLGLIEGFDEFRSVRDYRDGDPPRLIHWRTTARRGSLVVREVEPAASRNLLLVVDPRLVAGTPDPLRDAETVLSFAATVVSEVCRGASIEMTLLLLTSHPAVVRGMANPHRRIAFLKPLSTTTLSSEAASAGEIGRLLRTVDVRDRRLWIVSTTASTFDLSEHLAAGGARRLTQRTMLNASAGDLDRYWIPPENLSESERKSAEIIGPVNSPEYSANSPIGS